MKSHCLRTSQLPHTTKLFADFLENFSQVQNFYRHPPTEAGVRGAANQLRHNAALRREVTEILRSQNTAFGCDPSVDQALGRLAGGAVAVVTGQQVGLFGGPAYSVYKALTAIASARHVSKAGLEAVPVFWMATEDHDLEEIRSANLLDARGELHRVELPGSRELAGAQVGSIRLGREVAAVVEAFEEILTGKGSEEIGHFVKSSYLPEETYGTAFGKLFTRLFSGRGLILLDPLDPRLHRLAAQMYRRAAERQEEIGRELEARKKTLEKAGYHAQVKVTELSTLLFADVEGKRLPVRRRGEGFVAGEAKFSGAELLSRIEHSPELFSPNALFRSVVQDSLLPTAAYVGGPAEVAYFAQAETIYRCLEVPMPAILPRASFTLVEQPAARLLKKYGLELQTLFRGRQKLRAAMERQYLSRGMMKRFEDGGKKLRAILKGMHSPVGKVDKTLVGALRTAERKMLYQFEKLREKTGRAANLRSGVLDRHEGVLQQSLYPHHAPQERSVNLLPILGRHGIELLDTLEQRANIGASQHHILFL